jgi:carboxymethylenebutenolidase
VFLLKSAAVTAGGPAMAQALLPRYARAQTISFTDPRIKATSQLFLARRHLRHMRGYLVQFAGNGPLPTVVVIHENRGLNPYTENAACGNRGLCPMACPPSAGIPATTTCARCRQASIRPSSGWIC